MSLESPAGVARVRFGPFEADLATGELFESGRRVRLANQSFIALATLLERPGQLVTRDELRERVWPDNRVVEFEQGLNAIMNRLREALGDPANNARFIETLPRRGYRFIGPIEVAAQVAASGGKAVPREAAEFKVAPAEAVDRGAGAAAAKPARSRWPLLSALVAVLALLVTVTAFLWKASSPYEASAEFQVTPLTSLVGQEVAPAFSPDGSQIAFAWTGESGGSLFDLYVKSLGSEKVLRLTHHPSSALIPAWSPDGTRIAFARQSDSESGLYLIPALGGAERRLAMLTVSNEAFLQIAWSPDSKSLAYASLTAEGHHQLQLLNIDTLESRPVYTTTACGDSGAPAFSPSGKELAFICMPTLGVYGIYLIDLNGGTPRLLTSILGNPRGLAWSSVTDSLLYGNEAGDGGLLWSLSRDGKTSRLPYGEESIGPGISARVDKLAYVHGTQLTDIWHIDLSEGIPETAGTRLISSSRSQLMPQYSPDGKRIVFQSTRSGSPEIWLAEADGSNPTRLTSFNGPLTGAPVWCSDGKRIAFDSRTSGTSSVYVMNIDERLARAVKTSERHLSLPAWSEDCRWIFASNGKSALYRIPAEGGKAERATSQRSYYATVAGNRLIFNVLQTTHVELWSKDTGTGVEAPLEGMPELSYADSWTATPQGIYFVTRSKEGTASLNGYDFATRRTGRFLTMPHAPTPLGGLGISVSRDGQSLLYTLSGESQSDIMLVSRSTPRGVNR